MRGLSGCTKFWWESLDKKYIDVRREDKNFDLSIWVLYSTKKINSTDSSSEDQGLIVADDTKEIWIPVFVLENKMKSLPYREQLEEYVDKAFDIWAKGTNAKKANVNKAIKNYNQLKKECEISFVLLSLLDSPNSQLKAPISIIYKNTPKSFEWKCKNYYDLFTVMKQCHPSSHVDIDNSFYDKIVKDYMSFIENLYQLALTDWKIIEKEDYISQVFPQKLPKNSIGYCKLLELQNLRIADIKEKICYDQLLCLLLKRLESENIHPQRVVKGSFSEERNEYGFLCRTNYFHNVGLFEIIFMINKKENSNDEPFFLTIQIQGNYYTHGISGKNIVETHDVIVSNGKKKKENAIGKFFDNKGYDKSDWKKKLKFFFDIERNPSKPVNCFPRHKNLKWKNKGEYYKYGSVFVYQCAEITTGITVENLIDLIVADVRRINKNLNITEEKNIVYFESDDEFTDFCIAPNAVVKRSADGTLSVEGQYSDMYKKYIEEGKTFIIKDEDSQVYKHQCVSKRVPVQGTGRSATVQLPVQNLEQYFEDLEDE
jgi:hypothetical protein